MQKKINMIVCCDSQNGIALNGTIPWKNKAELAFFKNITTKCELGKQNAIIMGRTTAYSINRILPDRVNYVLTKNAEHKSTMEGMGFICFDNIEDCIKDCNNDLIDEIFLIGGNTIYNWGLLNPNRINVIYRSMLYDSYNCDQFFDTDLLGKNFCFKSLDKQSTFYCYIYKKKQNIEERNYIELLSEIIKTGHKRQTRNAITYSLFGKTLEFDLNKSFPLLTTKKMFLRGIFEELKFFMLGQTDNMILKEKGVNIWNGNTTQEFIDKCNLPYKENDLGPMYGYQWRYFNAEYVNCHAQPSGGYDQLLAVVNMIKTDPFSRRIIMTSYNPAQVNQGVLYPCHGISIQFYVEEKDNIRYLNCLMNQRSGDTFLGIPFNIASYALLVHIICNHINCTQSTNMIYPGKLMMVFCDVHVYDEHMEAVKIQLSREPYLFPQIKLNYDIKTFDMTGHGSIGMMKYDTIKLTDYFSHDSIKAQMIA